VYFDAYLNHRVGAIPYIFPTKSSENLVIYINGAGSKESSALILDTIPDLNLQHSGGQCFSLYTYVKKSISGKLFNNLTEEEYEKRDNISDEILSNFRSHYNRDISKEDVFYYVYAILHCPEYKKRFFSDLMKQLPKIPLAKDFYFFSKSGRELANLHLNYETIEPYPLQEFTGKLGLNPKELYQVKKMTSGKTGGKEDKSIINYNSNITLSGIPLETYDYIVNGKSALEWIMERYQYTRDKESQITNDPNDWSNDPRYIIDLVKRIVRVSLETNRIVNSLPPLNEKN
jgi:predicted helicase